MIVDCPAGIQRLQLAEACPVIPGVAGNPVSYTHLDVYKRQVLVEVKVSRADFRADLAKPHRRDPALSGGTYRYYLAPAGLLAVDELPPRWGLIEYGRPRFRVAAGHLLVRAGPNLKWDDARSLRLQNWAHEVNHARELGTAVSYTHLDVYKRQQ